jgi:hypothetical protein
MRRTLTLLAAPLSLLPLLAQDPAQAPESDDQAVLTRDALGQLRGGGEAELHALLQGCWRLMDVQLIGKQLPAGQANGFMLIEESFLALEIQASWATKREPLPDAYQTVFTEYELDRNGLMTCSSLIGSYLNETGQELIFEPGGTSRQFNLEMPTRNMLVLSSLEGPRMTFARNLPNNPIRRSILGETLEGEAPDLDILGQPEPEQPEGETPEISVGTDIFGRPIRKPAVTGGN